MSPATESAEERRHSMAVEGNMIKEVDADVGPADRARRIVLEQHIELRRLLRMGMAQSLAAVRRQVLPHESLRSLVAMIREVFVQHLADEEALILPLLEDDLPLGPVRAKRLREEHTDQRKELETLCSWPEEEIHDLELALRFEVLGTALLDDITHEERDLLTPEVIRDDCIVVDQCAG
jgi:hypothetical protein